MFLWTTNRPCMVLVCKGSNNHILSPNTQSLAKALFNNCPSSVNFQIWRSLNENKGNMVCMSLMKSERLSFMSCQKRGVFFSIWNEIQFKNKILPKLINIISPQICAWILKHDQSRWPFLYLFWTRLVNESETTLCIQDTMYPKWQISCHIPWILLIFIPFSFSMSTTSDALVHWHSVRSKGTTRSRINIVLYLDILILQLLIASSCKHE